jgi:hypothetical protein
MYIEYKDIAIYMKIYGIPAKYYLLRDIRIRSRKRVYALGLTIILG